MGESELIKMLKDKDEYGIEELLKHYGALMRYVIAPILSSEEDCEECLSESVMKIWNSSQSFDPSRGSWKSWITAVCRNTALNIKRKETAGGFDDVPDDLPSKELSPEDELLKKERSEAFSRSLMKLPGKDRNLFYRKYYYLQPTSQIAAETGMTIRAVEGKLYRIKKQLKVLMGGEGYDTD